MRRRAVLQDRTRERITESVMELHATVGPSQTSISAVAAHAGVRRSTVYRHFPDEAALVEACGAHWIAANPPPDISGWVAVDPPDERVHLALDELYSFYGRTERMLDNLLRDETLVPAIEEGFASFRGYLASAADTLMLGRTLRGTARRQTRAALGHAVAFSTWKSLVREQGRSPAQAVALMRALVTATSTVTDRRA